MRTILPVLLLLAAACTQGAPKNAQTANAADQAASNTFAEMDAAAGPAYDVANTDRASGSVVPDTHVASGPGDEIGTSPMRPGPEPEDCGAAKLQRLVGKPRSEIPSSLPRGARVTCTSCPITMDYSPRRLNIFYDEKTGIIEEVRCG